MRHIWLSIEDALFESKDVDQNTDIAVYLACHDVEVETKMVRYSDTEESDVLMSEIQVSNCNLLVMGAYGHTRFREMIVGGMTKDILQLMPVPVFMTH